MTFRSTLGLLLLAGLLAGCGGGEPDAPPPAPEKPAPKAPAAPAKKPFDISDVPVSDAPLGSFPYFSLPAGYATTDKLSSTVDRAVFPFWVGDDDTEGAFMSVSGRLYQANIRASEGKTFAALEVQKAIDEAILGAGGVRLADGVIPRGDSAPVLTREFTKEYANGLCWPSEPVRTYVVHRSDRDIWVHACTYGGTGAAWVIVETDATAPAEAKAMTGAELKTRIDADGRVDVQVQFESDSDRMLSGSQAQISAIVELLQSNPDLSLSVNGHTDNSGAPARNLELSAMRARKVMEALVGRGIEASRLRSHGFGREQPIADNGTPEGRARNRRVELEKI